MSEEKNCFSNPGPQALIALAISCFIFFAILTGKVGVDSYLVVAAWLFGGFVCQFTAGIIDLKDKNLLGGNIMLIFSSFFMLVGALEHAAEFICHATGVAWSAAPSPYAFLVLCIILTAATPAYLTGIPVMFMALVTADVSLWSLTLMKFGVFSPAFALPVGAYGLLLLGCLGTYMAAAIILNDTFQKVILPLGKPLVNLSADKGSGIVAQQQAQ